MAIERKIDKTIKNAVKCDLKLNCIQEHKSISKQDRKGD